MMKNHASGKARPWQSALLATSGLAAMFVVKSSLLQAGHTQGGFLLAFLSVWALIDISWSNVDYTEVSSLLLPDIVDHNFSHLQERIQLLEEELEHLRSPGAAVGKLANTAH